MTKRTLFVYVEVMDEVNAAVVAKITPELSHLAGGPAMAVSLPAGVTPLSFLFVAYDPTSGAQLIFDNQGKTAPISPGSYVAIMLIHYGHGTLTQGRRFVVTDKGVYWSSFINVP